MKLMHIIHALSFILLINHPYAGAQQNEEPGSDAVVITALGVGSCTLVMAAAGFDTAKHYFNQNNYPKSGKICEYASHACLGIGGVTFFSTVYAASVSKIKLN